MQIKLPQKVHQVISTLTAAGYEAYAVGGCVRDSILGRIPDDWDITTSALPEQVKALFHRTVDTGIQHGTVTVILEKEGFEVTTYRIDGEYVDSRHPKEVTFTPSLSEDLKRRDFTINAMAYSAEVGLVDLFGGEHDIEAGIIRCVGSPKERFTEDALRIMRAIRFSAQLGYTIEENTAQAIASLAPTLQRISTERIQAELTKLVTSAHPEYLRMAYDMGVTKIVFPEIDAMMETEQHNPHHKYSVGEHSLRAMQEIEADKVLRLGMLLHDVGKPSTRTTDDEGIDHFYAHNEAGGEIAEAVLKRLRYDNATIDMVKKITLFHDYEILPEPRAVRRAVNKIGEDVFPILFPVKYADIMAQSDHKREAKLERLETIKRLYQEILSNRDCISLQTLAVTGKDLIDMGMKPGREIGDTLNDLLKLVMENPEYNTKEYLLKTLRL